MDTLFLYEFEDGFKITSEVLNRLSDEQREETLAPHGKAKAWLLVSEEGK